MCKMHGKTHKNLETCLDIPIVGVLAQNCLTVDTVYLSKILSEGS